ncbi:MAG: D-glycero-beta-D-manno-heptose-7-phosphate kinase [Pseudomonadota bacterium]
MTHPFHPTLIERFARARLLVIGDVILDRYLVGKVDRISPEAPIPVLLKADERSMLGGAANVALQIAQYGATAEILGIVGEDARGAEIASLAEDNGVIARLLREPGRPTSVKTRVIAQNQQMIRIDAEDIRPPAPDIEQTLLAAAETAIAQADIVVLSDYAKGVLTGDRAGALIDLARKAGKPVLVDPKSRDFGCYRHATAISPNAKEVTEATAITVTDNDSAEAACRKVLELWPIEAVVLTRGGQGMSVLGDDPEIDHIPAHPPRKLFDVSGAGDTAIATIATGMAAGLSLNDAARLGNIAAGIAVGKFGTATVSLDELRGEIAGDVAGGAMTWDAAAGLVRQWQSEGHTVGFTNGVFDLLHEGHLFSLEQAAQRCDRLVVGVNSDASTKRLKGDARPMTSERARARLLSALRVVDAVVIFDQDTPFELITAVQPDRLFKGRDYSVETVVGREVVEARGGSVVLLPLVDGVSTTDLIGKMGGT